MLNLVEYSSSSSSSDEETGREDDEPSTKKTKPGTLPALVVLPKASLLLTDVTPKVYLEEQHIDDSACHNNRKRSFPHERGNWASHVFIPVDFSVIEEFSDLAEALLKNDDFELHPIEEPHISLSRTFVLQYHLIESFAKSLEDVLEAEMRFSVALNALEIYSNEEKTRTFVAFKLEKLYLERLLKLLKKVNNVLQDFRMPSFYEEPSFHVSFLWCLGDQVECLSKKLDSLGEIVATLNREATITVNIKEIFFKCGHKSFKFELK